MRVKTTVTEKKLAANRLNAKRSTGPRTERGKNVSRFNAVTTSLFARHIVIPAHDEDDADPQKQFSGLLADLQKEYRPEGASEVFCVAQMAECMWKQRRISRSEKSLVETRARQQVRSHESHRRASQLATYCFSTLEKALQEIQTTRTLSLETRTAMLRDLESLPDIGLQVPKLGASDDHGQNENGFNDQLVRAMEEDRARLFDGIGRMANLDELATTHAARVLPDADDLEQMLRYDKALQKKFDWALQRLLESQARRQRAAAAASEHARLQ